MRTIAKLFGLVLVAATLTLAGCAPVASSWGMGGPGLQLGITPTGHVNLFNSQCSLMGSPGNGSPLDRTASAAAVAMSRMQQVSQTQAKLSSAQVGSSMASWKRIAGGGC